MTGMNFQTGSNTESVDWADERSRNVGEININKRFEKSIGFLGFNGDCYRSNHRFRYHVIDRNWYRPYGAFDICRFYYRRFHYIISKITTDIS